MAWINDYIIWYVFCQDNKFKVDQIQFNKKLVFN